MYNSQFPISTKNVISRRLMALGPSGSADITVGYRYNVVSCFLGTLAELVVENALDDKLGAGAVLSWTAPGIHWRLLYSS